MDDQLACMLGEIGEQTELGGRQANLGSAIPGAMVVEVDQQVAVLDPARPLWVGRRRSPKGGLDPRHQLREAEGLGHVIVRAELQAADLVGLRAARRDHQDRHAAELPDSLDDLPAVETGERDVEDDERRMLVIESLLSSRIISPSR